jgi:hypothetical protein
LNRNSRTKSVQTSLLPSIPSILKTFKAPIRQQVLFSKQNTFHTQFKIPRNIMFELSHNHSRNPRHIHPFPCVGPYRNACNNSRPFPDILSIAKVFLLGFFSFSSLDQVLLLPIYNTPNQNQTTLF